MASDLRSFTYFYCNDTFLLFRCIAKNDIDVEWKVIKLIDMFMNDVSGGNEIRVYEY